MPRQAATEIWSIYGQIEAVAANAMIEKYGLYKIEPNDCPPDQLINVQGEHIKFAVVMPRNLLCEFETTIANLRA